MKNAADDELSNPGFAARTTHAAQMEFPANYAAKSAATSQPISESNLGRTPKTTTPAGPPAALPDMADHRPVITLSMQAMDVSLLPASLIEPRSAPTLVNHPDTTPINSREQQGAQNQAGTSIAEISRLDTSHSATATTSTAAPGKSSSGSDSDDRSSKPITSSAAFPELFTGFSSSMATAPHGGGQPVPHNANMPAVRDNLCETSSPEAAYEIRALALSSNPAGGPVQLARLVNNANQTEMRIGLNTVAFGTVQVRTMVHASDVGVQIGSEKGDLHSLLSNDLPGIAHNLQQQDLRLTHVSFQQNGFSYAGDASQQHSQSRSFGPRQDSMAVSILETPSPEIDSFSEVRNGENGLSILA
jgi:flagellar hook-length control protein FliK